LSALADADDDDDAVDGSVGFASAEKSPAIEGLPMGSVTEDVAANLAADLAAAVAADNEKATLLGGEVRADKPQPRPPRSLPFRLRCASRRRRRPNARGASRSPRSVA
jgi:hypothetical protein